MFGWFRPSCPVNPRDKAWTERRMAWLVKELGLQRLREVVVVLPTPEFFPDPYDATEADARILFARVCRFMGVDPNRVDLDFFDAGRDGIEDAGGLYVPGPREKICIEREQLQDPLALVSTMAHELGHVHLLGDRRISSEETDQEWLTDLLTVFLGLGVFRSNSVIRERSETRGNWYYWSIRRQGYLPERIYGYALSLFAWARRETRPPWASHLRLNAREPFKKGLHYLTNTQDSLFQPEKAEDDLGGGPEERLTRLIERLKLPSNGARVAALWDLRDPALDTQKAVPELIHSLKDPDPHGRSEAVQTLAFIGPGARASVPALVGTTMMDDTTEVRMQAIAALTEIGQDPQVAVPALISLLRDPEPGVRLETIRALPAFRPASRQAVPCLVNALEQSELEEAEEILRTLGAMGEDATGAVSALRKLLRAEDRTLHASVRQALRQIRAEAQQDP